MKNILFALFAAIFLLTACAPRPEIVPTDTAQTPVLSSPDSADAPAPATNDPTQGVPPAQGTPPAQDTPPAQGKPPAQGTPPAQDTPPAQGKPPAQGTSPAQGTPPAQDGNAPAADADAPASVGNTPASTPPKNAQDAQPQPSAPAQKTVSITIKGHENAFYYHGDEPLQEGDTAATLLQRFCEGQGIALKTRGSGKNIYIVSIAGQREFDFGPLSGWQFSVNGKMSDVGSGRVNAAEGDKILWQYVTTPTM